MKPKRYKVTPTDLEKDEMAEGGHWPPGARPAWALE
jgi:hypothetical protein